MLNERKENVEALTFVIIKILIVLENGQIQGLKFKFSNSFDVRFSFARQSAPSFVSINVFEHFLCFCIDNKCMVWCVWTMSAAAVSGTWLALGQDYANSSTVFCLTRACFWPFWLFFSSKTWKFYLFYLLNFAVNLLHF